MYGVHMENLYVNKQALYVLGKRAFDLRYANDTDAISLAVMDNTRVVTAHKDLNIVCWNIIEGMTGATLFFVCFCLFVCLFAFWWCK